MDISKQRARQFKRNDFEKFDLILAMDAQNKRDLLSMTQDKSQHDKVHLFMHDRSDVPDPYHGTALDFARVFEMVRSAAQLWMERINAKTA